MAHRLSYCNAWLLSVAVLLLGYQRTAIADDRQEKVTNENNALTTATLPQLTAIRGGSLGIPSAGAISGLQANLDAQLFGSKTNADAFAQLGGLHLNKAVSVDVFAQLLEQDLPRFLHNNGTVQPEMFTTKLSAAGMRARIRFGSKLLVSQIQSDNCLSDLSHSTYTIDQLKVHTKEVPTSCNIDEIKGETSWTGTLGASLLRRTSNVPEGTSSNGAAAEAILQRDGLHWSFYVGLSGTRLVGANDKLGTSMAEFPTFSTLRSSAGVEYRGGHSSAGELAPRVGVYGVSSHAWWHHPYTFGTIEPKIQSNEFELGVYAGGKFTDKFSGTVAFRMLRPFGPKQDTVFVLSLMPSASPSPKEVQ